MHILGTLKNQIADEENILENLKINCFLEKSAQNFNENQNRGTSPLKLRMKPVDYCFCHIPSRYLPAQS